MIRRQASGRTKSVCCCDLIPMDGYTLTIDSLRKIKSQQRYVIKWYNDENFNHSHKSTLVRKCMYHALEKSFFFLKSQP